jgi:phage terminase large subunit-like protein
MSDTRVGRQTPTNAVVLPYEDTKGGEAVLLYNQSKRKVLPWQESMIYDIMATDENGHWTHIKFGWSIPRRNGKSELLIIRAIWALTHGERVLYTAHLVSTSHNAWEKISDRLSEMGFVENDDFKNTKQRGAEVIEWLKGGGGVINFRTRTVKGGLGEGYDLLIIDEAQEYTSDQESALKYVVTDSKNPQTLMCGTPPTAVSAGTVFKKYRQRVNSGQSSDNGWAEWGVPKMSDTRDRELWYETNPSLGYILSERTIADELGDDEIDDNIQRLGLWILSNLKSAISRSEWQGCLIGSRPELDDIPKIYIGVKYSKTSASVSAAAAVRLSDGRIFVEALDCRSTRDGNSWMIAYFRNPHIEGIAIDGANGASILAAEMEDADIDCKPIMPKVAEVIEANSLFEKELFAGNICHADQPALEQIVTNCEHRAIGSGGGFGYSSILEGAEVSILDAVLLAHWLCATAKEEEPQYVSY